MTMTAALYALLAADVTLAELLSAYRGQPAIFTADPVPSDARFPFLVISAPDSDRDAGYKNLAGREVVRRIRVYTEATGSVDQVESIAHRVATLLHRRPFGAAYVVDVTGPELAPSSPDVYGRTLIARALTLTP